MPYDVIEMKQDNFQMPVFIKFPKAILVDGKKKLIIGLFNKKNEMLKSMEVDLVGPIK